ncbi:OmpA family protein [Desulfuromonas carbonis]|uniref:OmpA/MotB family protein n=1 Tax=Desulfuromonas sp. DDH964 TaxID=1823759 RepID=UPI00078BA257|nr:OmpA family protein [Desulfuromonas sp. DDH964]AMV71679.1 peptidoglycan-binding lipoprotein, OmpA family [Desulfuromonas sp. DDH964]
MRPIIFAIVCCLALSSAGCVGKSKFEEKVAEANRLDLSLQQLTEDHRQLGEEAARLREANAEQQQELAACNNRLAALDADLQRSRDDTMRLETVLSDRSAQTGAAMAEMRQTIDRLETANRTLNAQLETEQIARDARIAHIKNTYDELVGKMESEIARGEVTISELQGKLTVNLVESILFDSGKADVKQAGLAVLKRVGDILKKEVDKEVRVEGYTDNIPISPRLQQTFPSNWELSTARATNVVHFLQEQVGIPGDRISACGFGPFRPLADNATAAGRAQNRRIQIVLVPLEQPAPQPIE